MLTIFRIAMVMFAVCAATSARADAYFDTAERCRAAIAVGDRESFQQHADNILEWRSVFNTQAILTAAACLTKGFNAEWEYHHPTGRFVASSTLSDEKAAIAERAAARNAQEKALAVAGDEILKLTAEAMAANAKRAEENRQNVRSAVYDACSELLKHDRVAALTNASCIDSFVVYGLPSL